MLYLQLGALNVDSVRLFMLYFQLGALNVDSVRLFMLYLHCECDRREAGTDVALVPMVKASVCSKMERTCFFSLTDDS